MNKAEKEHKNKVARLGCMVCRKIMPDANYLDSSVELHHLRSGRGWGKGDYMTLIPLCFAHHRGDKGIHGLGSKGFPKYYGFTEQELLEKTLELLNDRP